MFVGRWMDGWTDGQTDGWIDSQKTLLICRSCIAWQKLQNNLGTQFIIGVYKQYNSYNIKTTHNILQSTENMKWVILAIRLRRVANLNNYDEQREQPLHPSSIIELTSFLRILLSKIFNCVFADVKSGGKFCHITYTVIFKELL